MTEAITISPTVLQSIDLFKGIGLEKLKALSKKMSKDVFVAGAPIVLRQDIGREVFFIVSGEVRVTSFSESGKEASYSEKRQGDFFGELAAIDGKPRIADVVAVTDAVLLRVGCLDFNEILRGEVEASLYLIRHLANEVRRLTSRAFEYSTMNVQERICKRIYEIGLKVANGNDRVVVEVFPRHYDIASRVSTSREAVTREIGRLIELGLLVKSDQGVCIPSLSKLKELF